MNDKFLIMNNQENNDDKIQKIDWKLEDLEKVEWCCPLFAKI